MTCTIINPVGRILVEKTPGLKRLWVSYRSGILPWKLSSELLSVLPLGHFTQEDFSRVREAARKDGIELLGV